MSAGRRRAWIVALSFPALVLLGTAFASAAPMGAAGVPPTIQLVAAPSSGSEPLLVDFVATLTSSGTTTVTWQFGDGTTVSGSGPSILTLTHRYADPGNFLANVTATDPNGSATASRIIHVAPLPVVVNVSATPESGPAPLTVAFNGSALDGSGTYASFAWRFGDGGSGQGVQLRYTYDRPGRFSAVLNVTDSDGLSGSARVVIYVSDPGNGSGTGGPTGGVADPWGAAGTSWVLGLAAALAIVGVGTYAGLRRLDSWTVPAPKGSSRAAILGEGPLGEPGEVEPGPSGPERPTGGAAARSAPHRPPAVARRLADRTIAHLRRAAGPLSDGVARPEQTQAGIARAIGCEQNVASKVLRRLEAAGAVAATTQHVAGQSRRVKTYRLTAYGEAIARELARRAGAAAMASGEPDPPG